MQLHGDPSNHLSRRRRKHNFANRTYEKRTCYLDASVSAVQAPLPDASLSNSSKTKSCVTCSTDGESSPMTQERLPAPSPQRRVSSHLQGNTLRLTSPITTTSHPPFRYYTAVDSLRRASQYHNHEDSRSPRSRCAAWLRLGRSPQDEAQEGASVRAACKSLSSSCPSFGRQYCS